ncbi:MAG TPA: lysophospholipid acyltransferase family protein [Actinomycetota bacterium]|nr:lysophospholipid acyltransferase family protein [Actinomycetota bacterium]
MFYWLVKHVFLGPLLKLLYRPKARGLENVPGDGPVILAANHVSFMDSLFIPLVLKRRVVYLGKSDYFDHARTRWFFKMVNVIPVKREGGTAGEAAIRAGVKELDKGLIVGIYPEGTRSPDGRLYRGKTGVARMALLAKASVVPVGVFGTRDLQPPDRKMPKLSGRIQIVFGRPLDFTRFEGQERDRFVLRSVTDEILYEIMMITGQEYVDEYASRVKAEAAKAAAGAGTVTPAADLPGEPGTLTDDDAAAGVKVVEPEAERAATAEQHPAS